MPYTILITFYDSSSYISLYLTTYLNYYKIFIVFINHLFGGGFMNKRKLCVFLCCLNLANRYSDRTNGFMNQSNTYQAFNEKSTAEIWVKRSIKGTALAAGTYGALNQLTRYGINTGNLLTQKVISFFRGKSDSINYANIPVSKYTAPLVNNKECGKFWSEQKLKSGGRMIVYSPAKETVKKVWICFCGCSSYGLDGLKDFWGCVTPDDEPNTAFVAVDYPGYGTEAPGGKMNEKVLKNIADEVVDNVSKMYDSKAKEVEKCIWGHSLGTFPASWKIGDNRIKEIYLHSPVDLKKVTNSDILGMFLVVLNAENLNAINNLIEQGATRTTQCKVTIVSGGRKKNDQNPGSGPHEFLSLEKTIRPKQGKALRKLVSDGKINITCKIKKSAGHCNMFRIDDKEAENYNYLTGKIEPGP